MLQNQHTSILVRARVYNNVRARVGTKWRVEGEIIQFYLAQSYFFANFADKIAYHYCPIKTRNIYKKQKLDNIKPKIIKIIFLTTKIVEK